ncbi:MAG: response regulator [Lachnospiraceae bacterium]
MTNGMFGEYFRREDVLYDAEVGIWQIELSEGKEPRMMADQAMLELLGIEGIPTPEDCYLHWNSRIEKEYLEAVDACVETMISGRHGEVNYAWQHPKWGKIYVRCGGTVDINFKIGIRLRGYHQNVTELIVLKKESERLKSFNETMLASMKDLYFSIMMLDLEEDTIYPLYLSKGSEQVVEKGDAAHESMEKMHLLYHPKDRKRLSEDICMNRFYEQMKRGEDKFIGEYRRKINGAYRWVSITCYFIQKSQDKHQMMLAVQDIHDQKKQEKEYQEYLKNRSQGNLELLRMSLKNTNIFEYLYYPLEEKIVLPQEVAQYYQCDLEYVNRTDVFAQAFVDEEYYEEFCEMYRHIKEGEKYDSLCYSSKNGAYWCRGSITGVSFDEKGNTLFAVGIIEDITQQKSAEKEKERYQSIYKFTVENEYDGISIVDLQTNTIEVRTLDGNLCMTDFANDPSLTCITGTIELEEERENQDDFNIDRVIEQLEAGKEVVHFYYQTRKALMKRHKELTARYFNEKRDKLFICVRDIEQQIQIEEKSKEALKEAFESAKRANQAKSEFLTKMSHDIRTPMNAIVGMTTIAEVNVEDKKRVQECLDKIKIANSHLLRLVNEVLDMSRIESGKLDLSMEEIDIIEVLQSVITMQQPKVEENQQKLKVEIETIAHSKVIGDYLRLQKVFTNILSNAVKYTQPGGYIQVKLEECPSIHSDYGHYQITFQDNGYGMSKEFQKKLFDPFERATDPRITTIEGTGLGMPIAYNIVHLMKGDIQVKSEIDKGSEFIVDIYLKLQEEAQIRQTRKTEFKIKEFPRVSFYGKRALLVEDNELNVEIANEILKMFDLEVMLAYNGQEAVECYVNHEVGYFDIIFMDIQMPIMNGYTAAEQIRLSKKEDASSIPILAMTANAFSEDVQKAVAAGMNDHIAKPIELQRLLDVMIKWLS